jgi:outer membrane protein TolC
MVKSARRKTPEAVVIAVERSSKSLQNRSGQTTDRDIARRAYELYEERGREHGHDIDDWLQAERDLRDYESYARVTSGEGITRARSAKTSEP